MILTKFLLFFSLTLFVFSCKNNREANLLISNSKQITKYSILKIEKRYTERDSLYTIIKGAYDGYDSLNRLINSDDVCFYFYNKNNKIDVIKSILKREGKGFFIHHIVSRKYVYDKKNNLLLEVYSGYNKVDTLKKYNYDKNNRLASIHMREGKILYKYYDNGLVSEKITIENKDTISILNFKYNKDKLLHVEDKVEGKEIYLRTYYNYNSKHKLLSIRDSSCIKETSPDSYVEFLKKYYYDNKDSLSKIEHYSRNLSENDFTYRGKIVYEYKIFPKKI